MRALLNCNAFSILLFLILTTWTCGAHFVKNSSHPAINPRNAPEPPSKSHSVLVLEQSSTDRTTYSTFTLLSPISHLPLARNITIRNGATQVVNNAHITGFQVTGPNDATAVITSKVTFAALPGSATIVVSLQDPSGKWLHFQHDFDVIGVAFYEDNGPGKPPRILSGRSAPPLLLKKVPGTDSIGLTVASFVYAGASLGVDALKMSDLRFTVGGENWHAEELLPWDPEHCKANVPRENLNAKCCMAFSDDFSSFSLRVPAHLEFQGAITLRIDWPGLQEYMKLWTDSVVDPEGNSPTPETLRSDEITFARVDKSLSVEEKQGGLAAWKMAVIVAGALIVAVAGAAVGWYGIRRRGPATSLYDYMSDPRHFFASTMSPRQSTDAGHAATSQVTPSSRESTPTEFGKTIRIDVPEAGNDAQGATDGNGTSQGSGDNSTLDSNNKIRNACKRFLQADLLHGPVSLGLVGKQGREGWSKGASDFS